MLLPTPYQQTIHNSYIMIMILGMGKSFSSSTSPNRTTHSTPSLSPASSKPTNKYQYSRYSQKMSSYIDSPAWTQTETVDTHHHQHHHHINISTHLTLYGHIYLMFLVWWWLNMIGIWWWNLNQLKFHLFHFQSQLNLGSHRSPRLAAGFACG